MRLDCHGATDHHYLALDSQLRPVLAWFGAHLVPGGVYLQSRHFQEGQPAALEAIAGLESLAKAVISMQQATTQNYGTTEPPPLAAG